jgi:hypothetical protein
MFSNIPCCSVQVQMLKSIVTMNMLYVSGFPDLGIILFKQQNLMNTSFTCLIMDSRKSHLAVVGGIPKNYHTLLTIY